VSTEVGRGFVTERELKLTVDSVEEGRALVRRLGDGLGLSLVPEGVRRLESRYLDTAELALARCCVGVRVRFEEDAKGPAIWTAKLAERAEAGMFESLEFNVEGTLARVPATLAGRVRELVGAAPLVEIARLRNLRRSWSSSTVPLSVELDDVEVLLPQPRRFVEVEVEVGEGVNLEAIHGLLDVGEATVASARHKLGTALGSDVAVDPDACQRARSVLAGPPNPGWTEEPSPWSR
jgi:inorganic triphosphatase YgiF